MNFYICSTVRHLLFSLLKALSEPGEQHQILFFSDFQRTSLDSWDLSALPGNISVLEGNRRHFRKRLTSSLRGKFLYFLAMRNLQAPAGLEAAFYDTLNDLHPEMSHAFLNAKPRNLWLFNERNKMARVFRLINQSFFMIEEGSGNYHYFNKSWWRWPGRALLGRPMKKLSFGEDRRCKKLLVSYPENVPAYVRHKAQPIEFLDTPAAKQKVREIFKGVVDFDRISGSIIVATSPLDEINRINKEQKLGLYRLIIETLADSGFNSILKFHPRENPQDYAAIVDPAATVPEKLPLEVIILLSDERETIISFFTSAGIGLEPYFNLIELCGRSDSDGYEIDKLHDWIKRPEELRELVRSRMQQLPSKERPQAP